MDWNLLFLIACWGVLVGVVFSSIGAAGGILTSFGLISIVGIDDPNCIKPMTQIIVLATALVFVPGYFKRKTLVWPLGLLLGFGGLLGALAGSTVSSLYLADMATFQPLFGGLTLIVAARIGWDLLRQQEVPAALQDKSVCDGVSDLRFTLTALDFKYCVRSYHIPHWQPLLAGFFIAMIAAIFGVGGGFLLVPLMASLFLMPMHIIPATAAIAIFMSLTVSIANYLRLGAALEFDVLIAILIGAVIGALLGQQLNKNMKNSWLQMILGAIVLLIGVKYIFG